MKAKRNLTEQSYFQNTTKFAKILVQNISLEFAATGVSGDTPRLD